MSKPANLFDDIDAAAEERADQEAEADVAAGRIVPHDEVVKWFDDLAAGIRRPRPQPWK
jgi:predicted transcriptional regulator